MNDLREEIKKAKPIYGLDGTLKKLKHGKLKSIYIASNCHEKAKLLTYAKQFGIETFELKENNLQLGIICKKPYAISVLSFE